MLSTAIVDKSENFCCLEALSEIVNVVCQEFALTGIDILVDLGSARNREVPASDKTGQDDLENQFLVTVNSFRPVFRNDSVPLMHTVPM